MNGQTETVRPERSDDSCISSDRLGLTILEFGKLICSKIIERSDGDRQTETVRPRPSDRNYAFDFCSTCLLNSSWFSVLDCVANPTPAPKSFNWRTPIFDVMMIIVFLKSTLRPKPSVSCPSSSTCNNILYISGCAFSISSRRITL